MSFSDLNWLDYALIFVVFVSVGSGLKVGMARIGIGLVATVAGFVLGSWFYRMAGAVFLKFISNVQLAHLLGFLVIFSAVLIVGALLGKLLAKIFKWVGLSFFDRLLGAAFGIVRGVVICAILLGVFVALSPKTPPAGVLNSHFAPYVIESSNVIVALTPRELKDAFQKSYEQVKKQWSDILKHGKEVPRLERTTG